MDMKQRILDFRQEEFNKKQEPKKYGDALVHFLKCLKPYYEDVKYNSKPFEVRIFDRQYQRGDFLFCSLYEPEIKNNPYSGDFCIKKITYILNDDNYTKENMIIMGIEDVSLSEFFRECNEEIVISWVKNLFKSEVLNEKVL